MYRALFLLHNYNDVDHMTPVIDALIRTGRWQCSVVSYPLASQGSIDFSKDWRFAYLNKTHGVTSDGFEAIPGASRLIRLYQFREVLQDLCDRTPPVGRLFGRDLRGLLPWFLLWQYYDRFLAFWFTRVTLLGRELLRRYQPDVIAVDWGRSHGVIAPLLHEAAKRGIPILQLPHGAWTYEGVYSHISQIDTGKLDKKTRLPVVLPDVMVVDNVYKAQRSMIMGVPKELLRLAGLARFTPQWQAVLSSLPKGTAAQPVGSRPRLVWFTTWLMASKLDAVDATLAVLEEFADRIDIVLKVHTRNPVHEQADYGRRLRPGSRIRLVANEEESFAMTRWADMILITQSSIVYDAFLLDKPVIYLKYTHDFECIWETDRVADTVRSADALRNKLAAFVAGHYQCDYSRADVDRFLRLSVCGGMWPGEVLPAYVRLFDQAAAREPLTVGIGYDEAVSEWRLAGRSMTFDNRPRNTAAAA